MCGIFGVVGYVDKMLAKKCLDTLAHRGPDGEGLWIDGDVTLGHRRLSIIDLSENASQPMAFANDRYHITFNGEIYNYLELREELEGKGYSFLTHSDTEVLLAAFDAWGESCQHKFNGMWSFAIWDSTNKTLFLSRDRLGKKPLFYTYLSDGRVAFASEMKALMPLLDRVEANEALLINKEIVEDAKRIFNYESTEECLINGIRRLKPGYCAQYKKGRDLVQKRWWCTLDHLVSVPQSYEEQVEAFRDLFIDACKIRMRSDVPIGTSLSGGLDSSATISTMAHISNNKKLDANVSWQHAFVAGFPGTFIDETEYAKQVADHLGVDITIIDIDPLKAIDHIGDYFYLFEEIYITSPIPFMKVYESVKSHGISVTLDGHGADELFGGYTFDYITSLKDAGFNLKKALSIIDTYFSGLSDGIPKHNKIYSKLLFLSEWHAKDIARKILRKNLEVKSFDTSHPNWNDLDNLNKRLYVSTHQNVLPTLLRNYDRYSMANGVEIRMPFLDHRILSFAFSLPWHSKVKNGFSKNIIRDALSSFMPKDIAYRKAKIGFNSPVVDWLQGPLKEFILDTINSISFNQCSLINPGAVTNSVNSLITNDNATFANGERVWTLLMPYFWSKYVLGRQ